MHSRARLQSAHVRDHIKPGGLSISQRREDLRAVYCRSHLVAAPRRPVTTPLLRHASPRKILSHDVHFARPHPSSSRTRVGRASSPLVSGAKGSRACAVEPPHCCLSIENSQPCRRCGQASRNPRLPSPFRTGGGGGRGGGEAVWWQGEEGIRRAWWAARERVRIMQVYQAT